MLPILRILPVGGVLLAIMILVLALNPPGGSHPSLTPTVMAARGALMQAGEHPEWRQLLIQAAIRRADELSRLRELPDSSVRPDARQNAPKVAGLPTDRSDADPDDETGTINEVPAVTIPIEIGETSSTELPVTKTEEKPPVIRKPERAKPSESRKKGAHRAPRAKAPAKMQPAQFNLLEALFGNQRSQPQASFSAQTTQPPTAGADQR